jgi:hypothetical protein
MKVESVHYVCGVCGLGTGLVENDVADPDTDTEAPAGWLIAQARVVVANPDYTAPPDPDSVLAGMLQGVPVEQHAAVSPMLRVQAEAVANSHQSETEYIVIEATMVACPDHRDRFVALDPDAFEATPLASPVDGVQGAQA